MNEQDIPLRDFLATMNRLQADFERRLDCIEHDALTGTRTYARSRDVATGSWSAWSSREPQHSPGLEAIWTQARRPQEGTAGVQGPVGEKPFSAAMLLRGCPDQGM